MSTIHGIAASGLAAASARLGVSAHNVANALTPGFQPGRVEVSEVAGGGVATRVGQATDPLAEARADRALLAGGAPGESGTDLIAEVVEQSRAALLQQANLATLRTADETLEALLALKR
ncbi:MAG: flagellar basal body rod protein [Anaeromyxobacter sp.]|nr:flagellar basal body rod protein [Anaeromyxobacter sp.]MBL0275692.1 flagellar basal body rod protein [Anaeromyxobacter sp.]